MAGRRDEARALFYRWLPLIRYESQPGSTPGTASAGTQQASAKPSTPAPTRRKLATMKGQLEELAAQFDISPDELNLDLGPVGVQPAAEPVGGHRAAGAAAEQVGEEEHGGMKQRQPG